MQPNVSTPRSRAGVTGERETGGYVSENVGGIGQTILYYLRQPTVIGSLAMAIISAFVGVRVAQIQAMRRRRTFLDRATRVLSTVGVIGMSMMRMRRRRMFMQQMMRERGQGIAETTRDLGGTIMGNVSMMGGRRMRAGAVRSTAQQIGSAMSLIPVAIALLRNPVVRSIGLRALSRRTTRRMGFGMARGMFRR